MAERRVPEPTCAERPLWHILSLASSLEGWETTPSAARSASASYRTRMTPTTPRRRPAGPAVGARRQVCRRRKRRPRAPLRWWRRTPRSCLVMSAGLAGLGPPKRKSHLPKCPNRLPPGRPPGPSAVLRSLFMRRVPRGRGGTKVGASGKAVGRRKLTNEHRRLLPPPRGGTWSTSARALARTVRPVSHKPGEDDISRTSEYLFFERGLLHAFFQRHKLAPSPLRPLLHHPGRTLHGGILEDRSRPACRWAAAAARGGPSAEMTRSRRAKKTSLVTAGLS